MGFSAMFTFQLDNIAVMGVVDTFRHVHILKLFGKLVPKIEKNYVRVIFRDLQSASNILVQVMTSIMIITMFHKYFMMLRKNLSQIIESEKIHKQDLSCSNSLSFLHPNRRNSWNFTALFVWLLLQAE